MRSKPAAFVAEFHRKHTGILHIPKQIIEHYLIAFPNRQFLYIRKSSGSEAVKTCMYSVGYSDEMNVIRPL